VAAAALAELGVSGAGDTATGQTPADNEGSVA
jgi:hypothetical protein